MSQGCQENTVETKEKAKARIVAWFRNLLHESFSKAPFVDCPMCEHRDVKVKMTCLTVPKSMQVSENDGEPGDEAVEKI